MIDQTFRKTLWSQGTRTESNRDHEIGLGNVCWTHGTNIRDHSFRGDVKSLVKQT